MTSPMLLIKNESLFNKYLNKCKTLLIFCQLILRFIGQEFKTPGLGMRRGRLPAPALSPAQIKKKEAWADDEKPAQRQSCVG